YKEAVRLAPKSMGHYLNLGAALIRKQDYYGALEAFREAVRLNPKNAVARLDLAMALANTGDFDGAFAEMREALRIDPNLAHAHNGLAWLLATGPDGVRDGKRAVEAATRACELTDWKDPELVDTLAAAYAEFGDFDKAVEYQKKAVSSLTHELVDPYGSK